jgi:hypothetical protein
LKSRSSSSGLSGGAIGGIVGGVIGGLLLLGLLLGILWRRRKRHRAHTEGYGHEKEKQFMEVESGEPRVEPYVGRGDVDLGPVEGEDVGRGTNTTLDEGSTDLERQTKAMLGVTSPSTIPGPSRTLVSPIPSKSNQASSPIETTATRSDPSPTETSIDPERTRSNPVRREQEVEYVRHTDGGMVQVELPPLYTDVPRQG